MLLKLNFNYELIKLSSYFLWESQRLIIDFQSRYRACCVAYVMSSSPWLIDYKILAFVNLSLHYAENVKNMTLFTPHGIHAKRNWNHANIIWNIFLGNNIFKKNTHSSNDKSINLLFRDRWLENSTFICITITRRRNLTFFVFLFICFRCPTSYERAQSTRLHR